MNKLLVMVWCSISLISVAYAEEAVVSVQQKLSAIRTMRAEFSQTITTKHGKGTQTRGTMALKRPGRFRWQTTSPMPQSVIADGRQVWIYDEALEQATVTSQTKRLGAASALFLSQSQQAVADDFQVTSQKKEGAEIFNLRAKSAKASFPRVTLRFKGDILQGITLNDPLGQHIVVHFSHVTTNLPLPDHLFQFKVPAGVDVVRQ